MLHLCTQSVPKMGFDLIKLNRLWKECGGIVLVPAWWTMVQWVDSKSHSFPMKLAHRCHCSKITLIQTSSLSIWCIFFPIVQNSCIWKKRNIQHRGVMCCADWDADGVIYCICTVARDPVVKGKPYKQVKMSLLVKVTSCTTQRNQETELSLRLFSISSQNG